MDMIQRVLQWNRDAGRTDDHFNTKAVSLHIGLVLEECAELVRASGCYLSFADGMDKIANDFKKVDLLKGAPLSDTQRIDLLDACIDINVVSTGCMQAQGANVQAAVSAVLDANDAKGKWVNGRLEFEHDANSKIKKPAGWKPASLYSFISYTA